MVCSPFTAKIPEEYAALRLAVWLGLPLLFALVPATIIAVKGSWTLNESRLYKGNRISDGIDLNEIEWLLIGKPMTDTDQKRYKLTHGSNRYAFWKVIDNNLCLKTVSGQYLRLDLYFHNGGKELIKLIKAECVDKTVKPESLSENEIRSFKLGDSNRVFSL